jgi:tetratricopeptide (TPR) repeat protein
MSGRYQEAIDYFNEALQQRDDLGKTFEKHKLEFAVGLPITEEINVQLTPTENSILTALAEAYHQMDMPEAAIELLMTLNKRDPEDLIVRLSLAELLEERYPDAQQAQQQIVQLAEGVHNESPIHAALMYYRGKALRKLSLLEGALDTLNKALRRHKDYPEDLLTALRYERALVYEAIGKDRKAREEFEKVYAVAPSFGEVAAKLGL